MSFNKIIYAPGVRFGGGAVILKQLQMGSRSDILFIHQIRDYENESNHLYFQGWLSRLLIEICLSWYTKKTVSIFCFSNMALLPPTRRKNLVFLHNVLLLKKLKFQKIDRVFIYHLIKVAYFRLVTRGHTKFLVQTKIMKDALVKEELQNQKMCKLNYFIQRLNLKK